MSAMPEQFKCTKLTEAIVAVLPTSKYYTAIKDVHVSPGGNQAALRVLQENFGKQTVHLVALDGQGTVSYLGEVNPTRRVLIEVQDDGSIISGPHFDKEKVDKRRSVTFRHYKPGDGISGRPQATYNLELSANEQYWGANERIPWSLQDAHLIFDDQGVHVGFVVDLSSPKESYSRTCFYRLDADGQFLPSQGRMWGNIFHARIVSRGQSKVGTCLQHKTAIALPTALPNHFPADTYYASTTFARGGGTVRQCVHDHPFDRFGDQYIVRTRTGFRFLRPELTYTTNRSGDTWRVTRGMEPASQFFEVDACCHDFQVFPAGSNAEGLFLVSPVDLEEAQSLQHLTLEDGSWRVAAESRLPSPNVDNADTYLPRQFTPFAGGLLVWCEEKYGNVKHWTPPRVSRPFQGENAVAESSDRQVTMF